jgi:hypothetical protein
MGVGSVAFTRRTEASTRNILDLMQRPQAYNARAVPAPVPIAHLAATRPR